MIWLLSLLVTVISVLIMSGFGLLLLVCWFEEYFGPKTLTTSYPTDAYGEPIKDIKVDQDCVSMKGQLIEAMARIDLAGCRMDTLEDIEDYHCRVIRSLGFVVPGQFVDLLDYVDTEAEEIVEAGGPRGDPFIEDCWMRDQLVITLEDAEQLVTLINSNPRYHAVVSKKKLAIVVTNRNDRC